MQTLFVATGCDYTSFYGLGKATFLRYFYQYATFITKPTNDKPGTLADVSLANNVYNTGFLAFLRFVGVTYFKKHATAFSTNSPQTHFNSFKHPTKTHIQQHTEWIDDIRQNIWDCIQFETHSIPSTEALYRHWNRTCWVISMWSQTDCNEITLEPMDDYGWKISNNVLTIDWDSEENIEAVWQRVSHVLSGCKCRVSSLDSRFVDLENTGECATLNIEFYGEWQLFASSMGYTVMHSSHK